MYRDCERHFHPGDATERVVYARLTKIYIKMEEKNQELETKQDETHEKDGRSKRYGIYISLHQGLIDLLLVLPIVVCFVPRIT